MNYADLDNDVLREVTTPHRGTQMAEGTLFFAAIKKIATEGQPAPDADLAQHTTAVATGDEATPQEAEAHTAVGAPDDTGHLEGEFAVPLEHVVMQLAQIVSNAMRQHTAYAYYAEMMRDLGRGELSELFDEQAEDESNEMRYFLRRISVLQPGGVVIPVAPTPEPSADPSVALNYLIAGEQQAIVLFKTLRAMLGENPMKYTVEQIMTDAQGHLDCLWQYMPPTSAPEKPVEAKLAAACGLIKQATSAGNPRRVHEFYGSKKAAPQVAQPQAGDVVQPPPGSEPLISTLNRETMLAHAQSLAEAQDLRGRLDQTTQQLQQQQMQVESISAENANLQQQSAMAAEQAHSATEQATQATEQAMAQADAKMRLSMRIQQLRQSLADIVSTSDPVAEEGMGFGEQAGPGGLATAQQQQQMQAEMEAMQPPAEAAPQEAAPKEEKPKKDGDTKVEVKTSGLFDSPATRRLREAAKTPAEGFVARHAAEAGEGAGKGLLKAVKDHAAGVLKTPGAKALGAAGLVGGGLLAADKVRKMRHDSAQTRALETIATNTSRK